MDDNAIFIGNPEPSIIKKKKNPAGNPTPSIGGGGMDKKWNSPMDKTINVPNRQSMKLLSTIYAYSEDLNVMHQGSHPLHDFHERNLPWGTKTISPKPYLTVTF